MTTEREEKVIESHVQEELMEKAEEAREAGLHAAGEASSNREKERRRSSGGEISRHGGVLRHEA